MLKHVRLVVLVAAIAAGSSCGSAIRQGRSPVYLVVQSLSGQPGGPTGTITQGVMQSDVSGATDDFGQATLSSSLKDILNTASSPASPTANNDVTITQYHVEYVRSDGRNTPGVDVPYAFDGGTTATIAAGSSQILTFELVRSVAKLESPLIQMKSASGSLTTVANVTFYGHDQVGNQVSVTGTITIVFGKFGGATS